VERAIDETLALAATRGTLWPPAVAALAAQLQQSAPALHALAAQVASARPVGVKTRLHGDLHLGQVLLQRDDFVIIDFEGEPQRPLPERRAKHSALRDVAGMLRSFDYARHASLSQAAQSAPELERLAPPSRRWGERVRDAFLSTYRQVVLAGGLYADNDAFDAALALMRLFEVDKALYELRYEIDNRPDWVAVPMAGLTDLANARS
jgi:maltose alpha-D-glucosyltransferase/alpha-amylase